MNNNFDYDLAVIGGGTAGLTAALQGSRLNARTVLIEKAKLGGENLWTGSAPSKTLIQSARVMAMVARSEEFGVHVENQRLIWTAIRMRMAAVRDEIKAKDQQRIKETGLEVVSGTARFQDAHSIIVATANGERTISANKVILAAGTRPRVPAIPGLNEAGYLTHETIFDLPNLPRSLVIIGGGPAACELAQAFLRFGRGVTILEQKDSLLPGRDSDLSAAALKILQQEGVKVHLDIRVLSANHEEKSSVTFQDAEGNEQTIEASQIVIATGKEAHLSSLCLENAGVRWDDSGVFVDDYLRTGAPNIYACGDITGKFAYTHAAEYQARIAVGNALSSARTKADYRLVPGATFLDPEIAHLGLTEGEAAAQGEYQVYRADFKDLDRAIIDGETEGFLKVVTSESGRILGAHIAGARASELIHTFTPAIRDGTLIEEFTEAVHVYPTFGEIIQRVTQVDTEKTKI